jgi:RNA polymerase sigma factor (sigma-70 family)
VGRRVLHDAHAAEDVFQATFLTLARQASSVRKRTALSAWLHSVAYRLAVRAQAEAVWRGRRERQVARPEAVPGGAAEPGWRELRGVLDRELDCLPEKLRLPLVLCYLEGKTRDEAAHELGWPLGTLKSRLERGREVLRDRLTRRGLSLSAALLTAFLAESATSAAVPPLLTTVTAQAAVLVATGRALAAGVDSARVLTWVEGGLRSMFLTKLKFLGVVTLGLSVLGVGAGVLTRNIVAGKSAAAAGQEQPARPRRPVAPDGPVRLDRYGDPLPPAARARLGTLRLRHNAHVYNTVFTPDGKTVLAGDARGGIVFWDVAMGKALRRLQEPSERFYSLALSPDGQTLAAGSDRHILLWDLATLHLSARWETGDQGALWQVEFAPDGRTLASLGRGKTIQLWDVATARLRYRLEGHFGQVAALAFAPDGRTLASGGWDDPSARLWDTAAGKLRTCLTDEDQKGTTSAGILSVAFSPDGKTLVTAGNSNKLRFWGPTTGQDRGHTPDFNGVQSLRYFPDGKTVAGITNYTIGLWDAATGKLLREFPHEQVVGEHLAISPDGKTIATSRRYATFDVWDAATGKLLHHRKVKQD